MTGDEGSRRRRAEAGIAVDVTADGVRAPLARATVAALVERVLRAERVHAAEVSVTFLDAGAMAALNWRHLRHRGPTDVITFELARLPGAPVSGDVYVCPAVVADNARANGVRVREEAARVIVHATLHVLGHTHPEDEERTRSRMWRRQEALLARLLPEVLPPRRAVTGTRRAG